MPDFKHQQSGMTLMELLVALVIGSLVILLLTTGLGTLLNHYSRLQNQMSQQQRSILVHHWWQQTNAATLASLDAPSNFHGSPLAYQAHTLSALASPAGTWVRMGWRLQEHEGRMWLYYHEQDIQGVEHLWPMMPVAAEAQFFYLDPQSGWQETWRVEQQGRRLPRAIMLREGTEPPQLLAVPRSRLSPRPDYRDLI